MSGCDFQKKSFKVALNCKISWERWNEIFEKHCKCKEPAICGMLDKKKRLQCANCGKSIKREDI